VEVSASGLSLIQRSPTECYVCECDHEALIKRRPWLTWTAVLEEADWLELGVLPAGHYVKYGRP